MNTIWTFGDSLTCGFSDSHKWSKKYIEWKGYQPKVYGEFLSERLDYNLENCGINGADNSTIFEMFCKKINQIKNDDVIIFGWSEPVRFRIINQFDKWKTAIPNFKDSYLNIDNISVSTIEEIMVNRDHKLVTDEINNWINLINFSLKDNTIIHWTSFNKNINSFYYQTTETIKNETDGLIDDLHFSEDGQKHLSNIIENLIRGKKEKNII